MNYFKAKAMIIIAFALFICYYITSQTRPSGKVLISNIEYKKDSIEQICNVLASQKNWEEYYKTIRQFYSLGVKYKSMEMLIPLIEKLIVKIPLTEGTNYIKGQLLLASCHEVIGNTFTSQRVHEGLIHNKSRSGNNPYLYYSYNGLGIHHTKIRDYHQAVHYLKAGISNAKVKKDTVYLKILYNNMGIALLWKGDYSEAHRHLDSVQLFSKTEEPYHYIEKALTYLFQNDIDSCQLMIKKAKSAGDKTLNSDIPFYTFVLEGKIFKKKGDLPNAAKYFEAALDLNTVQDKREILKVIIPYVDVLIQLNRTEEALKEVQKAMLLFTPETNFTPEKPVGIEMNFIELFELKGKCYLQKFKNTGNVQMLYEAEKSYRQSLNIIFNMRYILDSYTANEFLARTSKSIFESSLQLSQQLYHITNNKKHLEDVFKTIQNFSSFNLKKTISERQALEQHVESKELIDFYLKTKSAYLDIEFNMNKAYESKNIELHEALKNKYLRLRDSIAKNNTEFKRSISDLPNTSIKKIQQKLTASDLFLQYFVSANKIYTFAIEKNNIELYETILDTSFLSHITTVNNYLSNPELALNFNTTDFKNKYFMSSYYIYDKLLSITLKKSMYKKIIIVPDGFLFRIPFEALTLTNIPEDKSYMVKNYTFNYLYYAAQFTSTFEIDDEGDFMGLGLEYDKFTLESMKDLKKNDSIPRWINESFRSEKFSPLVFADDEVIYVSNLFSGQSYVNEKATKSNFFNKVPEKELIHISAHSFVDYENPANSSIVLHKENPNANNLINVSEIANQNFEHLHLVTLSTCHSSSGYISETNGISSLTKSFFEAGSKSVLGSYWAVPDQYSLIFMSSFYRNLKAGMNKDEALRKTKLDAINEVLEINPAYNNPAFWSSWMMFGDVQPINTKFWTGNKGLILLLCLGLMSILILFWYKINFK